MQQKIRARLILAQQATPALRKIHVRLTLVAVDGAVAPAQKRSRRVVMVDSRSGKLVLQSNGKRINLNLGKYSVVRQGAKVKSARQIKPGDQATVSYVDQGKTRTAWYVYLSSGAGLANPCGGNPVLSHQKI